MLLLEEREVLRPESLQAAAYLVRGELHFPAERLLVDRRSLELPKSLKERTFRPRESDRGRPDRGIPGCLGHAKASEGPD